MLNKHSLRWLYARIKDLSICSSGIWFPYEGELVLWKFPWRRKFKEGVFVSALLEKSFPSLTALDKFWCQYFGS